MQRSRVDAGRRRADSRPDQARRSDLAVEVSATAGGDRRPRGVVEGPADMITSSPARPPPRARAQTAARPRARGHVNAESTRARMGRMRRGRRHRDMGMDVVMEPCAWFMRMVVNLGAWDAAGTIRRRYI